MFLWNEGLNHKLAQALKEKLPHSLIIMGGPQLDFRQEPHWFKLHPYVDLICSPDGYGEDFITVLLDRLAEESELNFKKIPNAVYPSTDRTQWFMADLKTNKINFKWPSNLFKGSEDYIKVLIAFAKMTAKKMFLQWETLRGCPYSCVYCEWGGGTRSKMSIKPPEVIEAELDFIEEAGFHTIYICDPNFGILERDVEIARRFAEIAEKEELKNLWFGGKSKNNKKVVDMIDRIVLNSKIEKTAYQISLNAIDPKQLKSIQRTNVSIDEQLELMKNLKADFEIVPDFELILGLPETTLDAFLKDYIYIEKVNAWSSERYPWALLPETPASQPAYIQKYQLQTTYAGAQYDDCTNQVYIETESVYSLLRDPKYLSKFKMVVATSSYTKEEWVEMYMIDYFVRTMECSFFSTPFRIYFRKRGVPVDVFFRKFWNAFKELAQLEPIKKQLINFVHGMPGLEFSYIWFESPHLPGVKIKMESFLNLLVLHEPETFIQSMRTAFSEHTSDEFEYLMTHFKENLILENINESPLIVQLRKAQKYGYRPEELEIDN